MKFNDIKMYMLYKKISLILFILVVVSCSKEITLDNISLPQTNVLKINNSWAVVKSTHLRLRKNPSVRSSAILTLWRSSLVEIINKTDNKENIEDNDNYWYKVKYDGIQGWVFGEYIDIYKSKNAAETSVKK